MNFITIDFETANNFKRSACALGLVKVENGTITEKKEWLIKPTPFEVGYYQKQVHNISIEQLVDKPTFDEIWTEIKSYIENQTIIAHNGAFDFGVLKHLFLHYEIAPIDYNTICSLQLSRKLWHGELSYGLSSLVETKLDNFIFNHHNALEDAEACARLMLKMIDTFSITDLSGIIQSDNGVSGKRPGNKIQPKKEFKGEINQTEQHIFFETEVVFTGTLDYFVRSEAETIIHNLGGNTSNSVTTRTNYLVMGQQDIYKVGQGLKSSKVKKAETLAEKGQDIQLISEKEFIEMLSN